MTSENATLGTRQITASHTWYEALHWREGRRPPQPCAKSFRISPMPLGEISKPSAVPGLITTP